MNALSLASWKPHCHCHGLGQGCRCRHYSLVQRYAAARRAQLTIPGGPFNLEGNCEQVAGCYGAVASFLGVGAGAGLKITCPIISVGGIIFVCLVMMCCCGGAAVVGSRKKP